MFSSSNSMLFFYLSESAILVLFVLPLTTCRRRKFFKRRFLRNMSVCHGFLALVRLYRCFQIWMWRKTSAKPIIRSHWLCFAPYHWRFIQFSMAELPRGLSCSVCYNNFKSDEIQYVPRNLICGHTYCTGIQFGYSFVTYHFKVPVRLLQ